MNQNQDMTVNRLDLKIDVMEGKVFPEVIVKPGTVENEIQSIVKFPGKIDKSLATQVEISNTESLQQLTDDISQSLSTTSEEDLEQSDDIENYDSIPNVWIRQQ